MKHTINILKFVLVILLCIFIFCILQTNKTNNISLERMEELLVNSVDTSLMTKCDDLALKKYYGLNTNDYEEFIYYKPSSSMDVDELLVIKVKNENQIQIIENSINSRLNKQKKSFEGYGIEQTKLLNEYVFKIKGKYIFFAVSKDVQILKKSFIDSLK